MRIQLFIADLFSVGNGFGLPNRVERCPDFLYALFEAHGNRLHRRNLIMRAFIALELSEGFASDIVALSRALEARLEGRFMPRENLHLTLAFLGEIGEEDSRRAIEAMESACQGETIVLRSDGLGKFGRPQNATLWLGIEPVRELTALSSRLREELSVRGVSFDDKPFKPHVTLARHARIPKGVLSDLVFPAESEFVALTLFRSKLAREGAVYKSLYSIPLDGER